MEKRTLRVLYTPPESQEYILARSSAPVPVNFIPTDHEPSPSSSSSQPSPRFGSVSLRTCAETICHRCPELLPNSDHDYTIYVLDPVEAHYTSVQASLPLPHPGVTVACGPMSRALEEHESQLEYVNGIFVKIGPQEALQVTFSLRKTARASQSTAAGSAAIRRKAKPKQEKKPSKPLFMEVSPEADNWLRTLPNPGRGRKSRSDSLVAEPDISHSTILTPSSSTATSQSPPIPMNVADLLSYISSGDPNSQQAALLALAMIDAPAASQPQGPNASLAGALQQMIAAWSNPNTNAPSSSSSSSDTDVVVLDKENVNPTAFRRRAEREREELKLPTTSEMGQTSPATNSSSFQSDVPTAGGAQSLAPSFRYNKKIATLVAVMPPSSPERAVSKRRLDDFLDGQDSRRDRSAKSRRSDTDKRRESSLRRSVSENDPSASLRHYSRVVWTGSDEAFAAKERVTVSSPPRPFLRGKDGDAGTSSVPIVVPDSPRAPRVAASSPAPLRRKYVVPEWARTETAMKPRLSEEKQREFEEQEKTAKLPRKKDRHKFSRSKSDGGPLRPIPDSNLNDSTMPPPVLSRSNLPTFASSDGPSFPTSSQPPSSRSTSPLRPVSRSPPPPSPKTPSPKRTHAVESPDGLFTPIAKSTRSHSPLFSPCASNRKTPKRRGKYSSPVQAYAPNNEDHEFDDLNRKLESAMEEINSPCDKLPISSDFDVDAFQMEDSDGGPKEDSRPVKQFWAGLPPSSPTRSMSASQDTDPDTDGMEDGDEVDDVPVSSSTVDTIEQPSTHPTDFGLLPPELDPSVFSPTKSLGSQSEPDLFDMFMNLSSDPVSTQMTGMDLDFSTNSQNAMADLDFSQFWESVKPLVEEQVSADGSQSDAAAGGAQDLDHSKLAEQVHTLFSGYLM